MSLLFWVAVCFKLYLRLMLLYVDWRNKDWVNINCNKFFCLLWIPPPPPHLNSNSGGKHLQSHCGKTNAKKQWVVFHKIYCNRVSKSIMKRKCKHDFRTVHERKEQSGCCLALCQKNTHTSSLGTPQIPRNCYASEKQQQPGTQCP